MGVALNWESQEVKRWLINDEEHLAKVKGLSAVRLELYVTMGKAPAGLYDSFNRELVSSWDDVDWNAVAERINDA